MFELIDMNNKNSAGFRYINQSHRFNYDGGCFYFGSLRSSTVQSIVRCAKIMTITTLNSVYVFERK